MEHVCVRSCYHKSRRYEPGEEVEFLKGEKAPRHFMEKKKYAKTEKKDGQENAGMQVQPLPNAELHYDKEKEAWSHAEVISEEEKRKIIDKKSRDEVKKEDSMKEDTPDNTAANIKSKPEAD